MLQLFKLNASYPIKVDLVFPTQRLETANGEKQLIAAWQHPKLEFDISKTFFDEATLRHILDFFEFGVETGFLFKDPTDHFVNDFEFETSKDVFTVGELFPISATEYQLCKVYRAGGVNAIRPITRPVNNSDFRILSTRSRTVDWETGKVTFNGTPPETAIKWQGYFNVPVILESQDLSYQIVSDEPLYSLPNLRLIELKESDRNFNPAVKRQAISASLNLDKFVDLQLVLNRKVSPLPSDSGWYKSKPLWTNTIPTYKSPNTEITTLEEVESAIALWRVTCGGVTGFRYQNRKVQAQSDRLSITAESEFNFQIASMDFFQSGNLSFLDAVDNQTYLVPIFADNGTGASDSPRAFNAIAQLRDLMKDYAYDGDQTKVDKYFKPIEYRTSKRWLDWLSNDPRDDASEANKVVFLIWINDSSPNYHDDLLNSEAIANQQFLEDLSKFKTNYSARENFAAIIYGVNNNTIEFDNFKNHLLAAFDGTNEFPVALREYGLKLKFDLPITSAAFYVEDLLGDSFLQKANYLCRCWQITKQSRNFSALNYASDSLSFWDMFIVPQIPEPLPDNYSAFVYGEYTSTSEGNGLNCGDIVKWRSIKPCSEFNIYIQEDIYKLVISGGSKTGIIPITDQEFEERINTPINPLYSLRHSSGCRPSSTIYYGEDARILDIVPIGETPIPFPTKAFFKGGQIENVAYGFKAKYKSPSTGQILETELIGSISGKISALEVYFVKEDPKINTLIYALAVTDDSGEPDFFWLQTLDGQYLTYEMAPTGIFNIEAIRLDGLPDTGGDAVPDLSTPPNPPIIIGFTNHDLAIEFSGITFYPQYGGNAQARQYSETLENSNNTETTFIFSDDLISTEDLKNDVLAGSSFTEWVVNWSNVTERQVIAKGYLGQATSYHNQYGGLDLKLEMRSLIARLQQKDYFLTVKSCPKTFGDQASGKCRVNLFPFVDRLEITEIIDGVTFKVSSNSTVENLYGQVTFTSGERTGITKLCDRFVSSTRTIVLQNSINNLAVGDTLIAIYKCDKTLRACINFNNVANHGGFPHVPGIDKAIRTNR